MTPSCSGSTNCSAEAPGSSPVSVSEILKPLPDIPADGRSWGSEVPAHLKFNRGKPISRVMRTRADVGFGKGFILGLGAGVLMSVVFRVVWLWLPILVVGSAMGF